MSHRDAYRDGPSPTSPAKRSRDDGDRGHDSRRVRARHDDRDNRDHRDGQRRRDHDRERRDDGGHRSRRDHHGDDSRHESRSHRHRSHRDHHPKTTASSTPAANLPFSSRQLSYKTDLDQFRPILARYLDVQKQRDIYAMDEREVRGRWKSFVSKWNAGELAEGWYDPDVFATAVMEDQAAAKEGRGTEEEGRETMENNKDSTSRHDETSRRIDRESRESTGQPHDRQGATHKRSSAQGELKGEDDDDEDDDADYGPALPVSISQGKSHGPGMPNLQDLAHRRELVTEERQQDRLDSISQLRADRKADRTLQRERLDELAPRADAGSHERKLEKKREVSDKMRAFAREKSPGDTAVDDRELMGGDDDAGGNSLAEHKKRLAAEQRKKTDREIWREEEARVREEEREERIRSYKEKEDRTMAVLQEIARQRFG